MNEVPIDTLTLLKEYGLAGVLAWLFWWTLRRTMSSHDATVRELRDQLLSQTEAGKAASDGFAGVVRNHMQHVCDALARFDTNLGHSLGEQQRWRERLLKTLDRIDRRLGESERRS